MTLEDRAAAIPHMGAREIGPQLRAWAAQCKTNIVEAGSWLGSGTAYLALGAKESGAALHVYDKWRTNSSEVKKAAAFGVYLEDEKDTLKLVRKTLAPFDLDIQFHKGTISEARWSGGPIGLFVLDAAKRSPEFSAVVENFWPHLEDGARLVLMDFHHYESGGDKYREQLNYMAAHPEFEMVEDRVGGIGAAVFVYHAGSAA